MRSPRGLGAAVLLLLALPLAIASSMVSEDSAEFVIHLAVGLGCVLLALAMADFRLASWVTWTGSAASAAFGGIFLLQATSQLIDNGALSTLAFDILGQEIEGVLPYLVLVWFVALLATSRGASRLVGWAVMSLVIGVEIAALIGPLVGLGVESQKALFILPFAWLALESVKRHSVGAPAARGGLALPEGQV